MIIQLFEETETEPKPIWWINFLRQNDAIYFPIYQINIILEPYGAQFFTENDAPPWGTRYIKFESLDNYVFFMLKWM